MLGWLAVHVELASIQDDLERRSRTALAAAGQDWASVAFDGRDGLLVGQAVSTRDREKAVEIVRRVWGVRSVRMRAGATTSTLADVPIRSAAEAPAISAVLDDVSPAAVGELPPSAAARVHAAQAVLVAALPPAANVHAHEAGPSVGPALASQSAEPEAADKPRPSAPAENAPLAAPTHPAAIARVEQVPAPDSAGAASPAAKPGPRSLPSPPLPEPKKEAVEPGAASPEPKDAAGETGASHIDQKGAAAKPQAPPADKAAPASETKPLATAAPPRFETAALPPGNTAANATCVNDVEAAAQRMEVHFARGQARLDTRGKGLIDGLIATLGACPEVALRVAGHADASGLRRHNDVLSKRRANSVVAYLVDKGIDAGRLVAVGYGDKQPVAPNNSGANRAKNRRIEFRVATRKAPLPPMPIPKQGTRNGLSHR